MKAEDINLAIARAMGWTFTHHNKGSKHWTHLIEVKDPLGKTRGALEGDKPKHKSGKKLAEWEERRTNDISKCGIPNYTTDERHAFQAVEWLETQGWIPSMTKEGGQWKVWFFKLPVRQVHIAFNQFLPLAICEAFCKACGAYVEGGE